jgi:hypothetical protein
MNSPLSNLVQPPRSSGNQGDGETKGGSLPLDQRQRETAQYISDMVLELRNLARSTRLFQVMVPLEYAYYEAYSMANRVEVPKAEIERIRDLEKASREAESLAGE